MRDGDEVIYFTKRAVQVFLKKLFYMRTSDGCNTIVYKQDKSRAESALKNKKDKYEAKCSIWLLIDKIKRNKVKDIYWLGVRNKADLDKKIFKILVKEKCNSLEFYINSKPQMFILTDFEIEQYMTMKTDESEWPRATAKQDDDTVTFLKKKMKIGRKISDVILLLPKLELDAPETEDEKDGITEPVPESPGDDMNSLAKRLTSIKVDSLNDSSAKKYTKDFENYLKIAQSKFKVTGEKAKILEKVLGELGSDLNKIDVAKLKSAIEKNEVGGRIMGHNEELIKTLIELVKVTEEKLKEEAEIEITQSKAKSVETKTAEDKSKVAKRAKDDSEVLEMKTQKSKEEFIKDVKIKKRAKDTSDLLAMAKKLRKIDAKKLKSDEIYYCVEDIKEFFKTAKSELGNSDPISRLLEIMIKSLDVPENVDENTEVPSSIVSEVINSKKQIYKLATKKEVI
jgi:hypothetical protein